MTKFAEKVVLLLKDEKLRRSMGESGRVRALELFSADRMAKEYLDAIEE
jgi:glycosyltransferase involved in cell wall biosynthesis